MGINKLVYSLEPSSHDMSSSLVISSQKRAEL